MTEQKSTWVFDTEINEIRTAKNKLSICAINPHLVNYAENGKLIASAPELLKACQNALKDIQKLNKQLIEEGKHGYILMENELNDVINLAVGS